MKVGKDNKNKMLYTSVIEVSHSNLVSDNSYLLTNDMLAWF